MYKIKNKVSGAEAQVTDAAWAEMKAKKLTEDPQEKKSWASKFKVISHDPDIETPQATFTPPEIALPEIQEPGNDKTGTSKTNSKKTGTK